jgi:hypothetical protein
VAQHTTQGANLIVCIGIVLKRPLSPQRMFITSHTLLLAG